jgi:hypothetical protein
MARADPRRRTRDYAIGKHAGGVVGAGCPGQHRIAWRSLCLMCGYITNMVRNAKKNRFGGVEQLSRSRRYCAGPLRNLIGTNPACDPGG